MRPCFSCHSHLVTGLSFMSVSWLVLESWQFLFIKDWPQIWKSDIPQSQFCPISGDWGKLEIQNLAQLFYSNKMLLNVAKDRGYSCYHFWVIEGQPTGKVLKLNPPFPPSLGLSNNNCVQDPNVRKVFSRKTMINNLIKKVWVSNCELEVGNC